MKRVWNGHARSRYARRSGVFVTFAAALSLLVTGLVAGMPAQASDVVHDRIVDSVPDPQTPWVNDGRVFAIAQVGNVVVVGGNFTTTSNAGGSPTFNRTGIMAFNATTGAILTGFNPQLNGPVNALEPGPVAGSVIVGGGFNTVNGAAARNLVMLNASTGQRIASFAPPTFNGVVNDISAAGNRLYVGGNFTVVGGQAHGGLAALNLTTGAIDHAFLDAQVSEHHNYDGDGAQAAIGVKALSVSPDGGHLAVVGNFAKVDGLDRDQAVLIETGGATAEIADWRTRGYEAECFSWAFDSYIRDVDFAPDNSYFVIVSTGGPNPGSLCDTAARYETSARGNDVPPVWVDDTGGDTLWSVAVTGPAVYTGGHQRWHNNAGGVDAAAPGAVPRPGLAAIDPAAGVPLTWNPGRNPRGAGAFALTPTADGLWMGSDTEWLGTFDYRRPRLAFFPADTGTVPPAVGTGTLPGSVFLGGSVGGASDSGVLFRLNAGGPTIPAIDGGPDWLGDEAAESPYRNASSNAANWGPGASADATVPASTPTSVFDSERWDSGDPPELQWAVPIPAGTEVDVRVYLANRCGCTSGVGQRSFDVALEGATVLDDFDIVAAAGDQTGTMRQWTGTSDGTISIDFAHVVENPLVNAIEIVEAGTGTGDPEPGVLYRVNAGGPALQSLDTGPDWRADDGATSSLRNAGSNAASWSPVSSVDATVPATTPAAVFDSERWDSGDAPELLWTFPVPAGREIDVRVYLANRCGCTSGAGQRVFDLRLEGATVLNDFDIVAAVGDQRGTMREWTVTSDGSVTLELGHVVENPLVNGIEIIDSGFDPGAAAGGDLLRRPYDGASNTGATVEVGDGGLAWNLVRGAVRIGNTLFYGHASGMLFRRAYDGTTFGAAQAIDPYNDPVWSGITTGSGGTYRGLRPTFYSELGNVTAMTYRAGKLYYTLFGQTGLYYRRFSADSGIVSPERTQVPGVSMPQLAGMFLSGNQLYFADRGDGSLWRIAFGDSGPTGASTRVSGPGIDGQNWRARALFIAPGPVPPGNQPPVASFTRTCTLLSCAFDGSGSDDPDGTVASYAWMFGDGGTATGATPSHAYAAAGTYTVTLTATDDDGATDTHAIPVTVGAANVAPTADLDVACDGLTCAADGSGSTDSDGTVASYAWAFGDGGTATGATASHTYAAAGSYDVTLTVTDDDGATDSATMEVDVAPAPAGVAFRAAASASLNTAAPSVVIPASVQAGDALLLFVSVNKDGLDVTTPPGWSLVGSRSAGGAMLTLLYERVALAGDAGSTVTPALSVLSKVDLTLLAYTGVGTDVVSQFVSAADTAVTSTHTTPTVATTGAAPFVVSYWADKSSTVTDWTPPAGVDVRAESIGGGSGRVTSLTADDQTAVPAGGSVGGLTATTDVAGSKATMWTVLLDTTP